jgi:hypothetical protein
MHIDTHDLLQGRFAPGDNLNRALSPLLIKSLYLVGCSKGARRTTQPTERRLPERSNEMVDYQYLTNPKHWRDRAAQTLAKAQQEPRPEARDRLQKVAREYEQLAERAERGDLRTLNKAAAQVVM